jgi:xyloglucan-specific exo-beta-1,4-glucanase
VPYKRMRVEILFQKQQPLVIAVKMWQSFISLLFLSPTALIAAAAAAVLTQPYSWKNVKIGGGGGFVPGIIFNPSQKGLAFLRTDIGGAYKLNADDSWTPLLDFADNGRWDYWGVDAMATDPVDPNRLYLVSASLILI